MPSWRMRRVTVNPSMSGSMTSNTMRSGCTFSITSMASEPEAAVFTSNPAKCREATSSSRMDGSSSTTTIDASIGLLMLPRVSRSSGRFLNVILEFGLGILLDLLAPMNHHHDHDDDDQRHQYHTHDDYAYDHRGR